MVDGLTQLRRLVREHLLHLLRHLRKQVAASFGVICFALDRLARLLAIELLSEVVFRRVRLRMRQRALVPNGRLARVVVALDQHTNLFAYVLHLLQLHVQLVVCQILVQNLLAHLLRAHDPLRLGPQLASRLQILGARYAFLRVQRLREYRLIDQLRVHE